jgi:hypothetical protein
MGEGERMGDEGALDRGVGANGHSRMDSARVYTASEAFAGERFDSFGER